MDEIKKFRIERLKQRIAELEATEEYIKASKMQQIEFRMSLVLRYHLNQD